MIFISSSEVKKVYFMSRIATKNIIVLIYSMARGASHIHDNHLNVQLIMYTLIHSMCLCF